MLESIRDEFMLPTSMSFYAIGKAEKKLDHIRAAIYQQTFWVPKRYEKKIITLLEVGKMVLKRLCSSKSKK